MVKTKNKKQKKSRPRRRTASVTEVYDTTDNDDRVRDNDGALQPGHEGPPGVSAACFDETDDAPVITEAIHGVCVAFNAGKPPIFIVERALKRFQTSKIRSHLQFYVTIGHGHLVLRVSIKNRRKKINERPSIPFPVFMTIT